MRNSTARRSFMKKTLTCLGCAAVMLLTPLSMQIAHAANPEKDELKLGFIKLTDMAPLAIAYEKGFFEDEGLYVTLEAQANWKVLLDRGIGGELDGAHMLSGQPIGATIGFGTKADVVTAFTMDLNGNAITVSNAVWEEMKKHVPMEGGKPVHPLKADTSGQIDAKALLSVPPPPQMPATMEAGTIHGYSVGEPWNQAAVFKGIGVPVVADYAIRKNMSEKVFGVSKSWAEANPETHKRVVKALIRAGQWLDADNNANRQEAVEILSRPEYVGADAKVIANSMTGTFEFEKGDKREVPDFNVFFRYHATYPYYSDAVWYLTQMRRWGQISEAKPDSWYLETAKKVYLPAISREAAAELIAEGKFAASDFPPADDDGFRAPLTDTIDGVPYDGRKPNAYLEQFEIGLKGDTQL